MSECIEPIWSAPRRRADAQADRISRFASMVSDGGAVFVAGSDIPALDPFEPLSNTLSVYELGVGPLPEPVGEYLFAFPRLYLTPGGTLGMVWAEPPPGRDLTSLWTWTSFRFATLLDAVLLPTGDWTPPQPIVSGSLRWGPWSRVVQEPGQPPRFVTLSLDAYGTASVVVGVKRGETWSIESDTIPGLRLVGYASLGSLGPDLALAVIAANGVWYVATASDHVEWQSPVLIQPSGSAPADDVQLVAYGDDGVDLIWVQATDEGRALRHTRTADRGRSWEPVVDLGVPGIDVHHPQAVRDGCGRVHVLFSAVDRASGSTTIGHAIWDGAWRNVPNPFPELYASDPQIVTVDGVAWMTFLGRPASAPPDTRMASYSSSGRLE